VPDSGTPLSSGANRPHSRKPPKPSSTISQPSRLKLRASVFTSSGVDVVRDDFRRTSFFSNFIIYLLRW
jgi:hypothetical protein